VSFRKLFSERLPVAGHRMSWRCITMAMAMLSSEVAENVLLKIMIFTKDGS
jgi:hypothetical protein